MSADYWEEHFIDCHCHILPGIDDGAKNLRETQKMLELAYAEGIDTMIATSHFRPNVWPVSNEQYTEAFLEAEKIAKEIDPAFQLIPGNEIFCEEGFMYSLTAGECQTLPNHYVLVEFPYQVERDVMLRSLEILQSHNYQPILAHVERYDCLVKNKKQIAHLREQGVLIQVNTDSLTGENGFWVRCFTRRLLKAEQIDLLGTDCHNTRNRPPRYRNCADYVRRHCRPAYAQALLHQNPNMVVKALSKEI